jgi:hypothetical protein
LTLRTPKIRPLTLRIKEIAENVIKNIENAKKYLNKFGLQRIIQDNKGKEPKYGTPEDCITGILENISLALDDQGEIVPRRGMTIICALVFKSTV